GVQTCALPILMALGGWKVQVFRDGGVLSNPPIERPTGGYAWSITAGLFDGDSVPDVVVSATLGSHGRFTFLRGDASTLLEGAAAQEVGDSLRLVGLSDLDGDADLDAVAVATTIGEVRT